MMLSARVSRKARACPRPTAPRLRCCSVMPPASPVPSLCSFPLSLPGGARTSVSHLADYTKVALSRMLHSHCGATRLLDPYRISKDQLLGVCANFGLGTGTARPATQGEIDRLNVIIRDISRHGRPAPSRPGAPVRSMTGSLGTDGSGRVMHTSEAGVRVEADGRTLTLGGHDGIADRAVSPHYDSRGSAVGQDAAQAALSPSPGSPLLPSKKRLRGASVVGEGEDEGEGESKSDEGALRSRPRPRTQVEQGRGVGAGEGGEGEMEEEDIAVGLEAPPPQSDQGSGASLDREEGEMDTCGGDEQPPTVWAAPL